MRSGKTFTVNSSTIWNIFQSFASDIANYSNTLLISNDKTDNIQLQKRTWGWYRIIESNEKLWNKSILMILEKTVAIIHHLKTENKLQSDSNTHLQDKYSKLLEKYNSSLEWKVEIDSKFLKLRNELSELKAQNFKLSSEKWVSPERKAINFESKDNIPNSGNSKFDSIDIVKKKNYKTINSKIEEIK